jgi:hypothetical protein
MKDESGWIKLNEVHKINPATMLPGYVVRDVVLPEIPMEADSQLPALTSSQ